MTDNKVYCHGVETLVNKLGRTGTIRFLNQIEPPIGDYTLQRHEWLDNLPDMDILIEQIKQHTIEAGAERKRIYKLKMDIIGNGKPQGTRVEKLADEDIYRLGLEFLIEQLGLGGMTRFLRLCEPERGIYALKRHMPPELHEANINQKNTKEEIV